MIERMLIKFINNRDPKTAALILRLITPFVITYEKASEYFDREVIVYVNHIYEEDEKLPYTLNGIVANRRYKTQSFTNIPWESIDEIIQFLEKVERQKSRKSILQINHGQGMVQEVELNRWAASELLEKLKDIKEKEDIANVCRQQ